MTLTAATLPGQKISIVTQGGASRDTLQFLRRLPDSRWNPRLQAWTCLGTPYSAAALAAHSDFAVDAGVQQLASRVGPRNPLRVSPSSEVFASWDHQVDAFSHALDRAAWYGAMVMGGGKSKVTVDLANERQHKRILVLCPTGVVHVWSREFADHSIRPMNVEVLNLKHSNAKKCAQAAEALRWRDSPLAIVVNYESAWREPLASLLLEQHWDLIVCDEAHRIKSPTGSAARYAAKLGRVSDYRIALSGTPMPHSPLDIFAQYRFLDPGIFGTSYFQFRNRYTRAGYFPGQIAGWINQEEFNDKLASCMFRVGEEVLTLPPMTQSMVPVDMQPAESRVYRQIQDDFVAELNSGQVITAPNALTRLMRLQQITCGWVGDGDTVTELGDSKIKALEGMLEDLPTDEPVVVFCWYRHDLERVQKLAERTGRRYGELSGRGRDLTDRACMPDDVDLMGVQMQSGGVGVDLTRAAYVFYYSLGYSWGDYEQSLKRAHRPGQDRPVRVYHLTSRHTVNEEVYESLRAKRDCVEPVLASLRRQSCR